MERCLQGLLAATGQDKSSRILQLIRDRWQERRPTPRITEQLGGHPAHLLDTLPQAAPNARIRGICSGSTFRGVERSD